MNPDDLDRRLDARAVPRWKPKPDPGAHRRPARARTRSPPPPSSSKRACARRIRSRARRASSGSTVGVRVAHAMEDCFVAAQQGRVTLGQRADRPAAARRRPADAHRARRRKPSSSSGPDEQESRRWTRFVAALSRMRSRRRRADAGSRQPRHRTAAPPTPSPPPARSSAAPTARRSADRVLRVTAESLNRLLGLAGESLVESRWLKPFAESLLRLKRLQHESRQGARQPARRAVGAWRSTSRRRPRSPRRSAGASSASSFWRSGWSSSRCSTAAPAIWRTGCTTRRSPAACGRSPTACRASRGWCATSARSLGKQVRLEIVGEATQVDRDILDKLEAPLGHLLRNAVDHGIESPDERRAAGKPAEGVVRLEARHRAGMLQITSPTTAAASTSSGCAQASSSAS